MGSSPTFYVAKNSFEKSKSLQISRILRKIGQHCEDCVTKTQ